MVGPYIDMEAVVLENGYRLVEGTYLIAREEVTLNGEVFDEGEVFNAYCPRYNTTNDEDITIELSGTPVELGVLEEYILDGAITVFEADEWNIPKEARPN